MAMPPMAVADPSRPAMAVSAIPTRGIVMPASILGIASSKICRLMLFMGLGTVFSSIRIFQQF